ncbi:MAG: FecR domain-containing protein [Verrucomicrobiota bacterium]|jgi:hypothetical protein
MKHIQTLVVMTLCGVALMFANNASAQSTKQGTATVVRIQGEARYSLGNNVWHPLVAGKILGAGAVIQTAVDSTVDLVLGEVPIQVAYPNSAFPTPAALSSAADPNVRGYVVYNAKVRQNVIRMYDNAVLAIDKLNYSDTGADLVGDTELDLRAGKIFGNVKKLSAMSEFEVKIPNGIAGIRGTCFYIDAGGTVTVTQGSVTISYSIPVPNTNPQQFNTLTETISAGQSYTPNVGISTNPEGNVSPNVLVGTYYGPMIFQDNGVTVYVTPVCGT